MTDFLVYFQNHLKTEMNPFPVSIYHPIIFTWGMLMILDYCLQTLPHLQVVLCDGSAHFIKMYC